MERIGAVRAQRQAGLTVAESVLVRASSPDQAARELAAQLAGTAAADLVLAFIDGRLGSGYDQVLAAVRQALRPRFLAGCSGAGVIGAGIEAEDDPAVTLLVVRAPGLEVLPVAMTGTSTEASLAPLSDPRVTGWLVFADPFSVDTEALVQLLASVSPGRPVLGGLASAQLQPQGTAVFLDGDVLDAGAVALGLVAGLRIEPVVAQGAEPIGEAWTITACERNVIRTLGNRPAIEVLTETMEALDPETRERARRNLLCGLAMDEYRDHFGRGDFLIRNIMGGNPATGEIAINAVPRLGQTFQFQFRDARAADEDLRQHLAGIAAGDQAECVVGAVLCACNGRGSGLFGQPDHDAQALGRAFGSAVPTAGLFCNGEIGPVGRRNFLHGFTASIALLVAEPAAPASA